MKKLLSLIPALALLAVPQVAGAADTAGKVEVTYEDAIKCAAVDTTLAIALTSGETTTKEDQDRADTLSAFADMWLNQASPANPGGKDATLAEISELSVGMFTKLADTENNPGFQDQFGADWSNCQELEAAIVASMKQ